MKTFIEYLEEGVSSNQFIGKADKYFWALKVDGVPSDIPKRSFGQQISYRRTLEDFTKKAKKAYISTEGSKNYSSAVKNWVKINKPSQFYGKWQAPTAYYNDDSLEIFYMD